LATAGQKDPGALKTIGELSQELGVAQHILRYWETKFPQLRPMQRAGNRRYYRPADVELAHRIHGLLNREGYTVRGVQKLLRDKAAPSEAQTPALDDPAPMSRFQDAPIASRSSLDIDRLTELRNRLADALQL
jgi:DNA-binding transcriptional MerR regulator